MSNTTARINNLNQLKVAIERYLESEDWQDLIARATAQNSWFTADGIEKAVNNIKAAFLNEEALLAFAQNYKIPQDRIPLKIGLVLAGNIPMVGFHDILMVYLSGHKAFIKYSEKDNVLIPWMINMLKKIDPQSADCFIEVEKMNDIDAVIATGSDNSARYFEAYFGKKPHIIRKNRNSVAILSKDTTSEEMRSLMDDVLGYFGLGCRNVSKLYLENGFDIQKFLELSEEFKEINNHNKYRNNYDYNLSLFLLNRQTFLQTGTLLMLEDEKLASRIATLHYQWFDNPDELKAELESKRDAIQCIVSNYPLEGIKTFPPGQAQCPSLEDFADNVDTMEFLLKL